MPTMRIHLCGVRGSTPAPGIEFVRYGGHTSCLALSHNDDDSGSGTRRGADARRPTLILDAGAGLQRVSPLLGGEPFDGTILLTHLHWDHVLGLPFFAAADDLDARISLLLPEQEDSRASAESVLAELMSPPYFPIEPSQLRGQWTFATIAPGKLQIEGFDVLAREIPHKGGRTFGYRISDGRSTLAYMPDHCPTTLGPGEDGFGEYHPAALELARGADVLVHDAVLFPEELAAQADFGHSVADYAVELGKRAGARVVVLFHHHHNRTDDILDGLARRLGSDGGPGYAPEVVVAAEGTVLEP
ncbi:MAG TPA: MBL fold metallo-hydrolase [bacterium]|nr:MBL fold metallo-hydrolase [bacterium]